MMADSADIAARFEVCAVSLIEPPEFRERALRHRGHSARIKLGMTDKALDQERHGAAGM